MRVSGRPHSALGARTRVTRRGCFRAARATNINPVPTMITLAGSGTAPRRAGVQRRGEFHAAALLDCSTAQPAALLFEMHVNPNGVARALDGATNGREQTTRAPTKCFTSTTQAFRAIAELHEHQVPRSQRGSERIEQVLRPC